tara:strand:- start:1636 stop:2301 length:666 start_codon:yes stop_codon:yes gene_type:complete
MTIHFYIRNFFIVFTSIVILNSCGFVGGDEKQVTEEAVLSGPPLAIPPDFDINSENPNQQNTLSNYDLESTGESLREMGEFEDNNENLFSENIEGLDNSSQELQNVGEIQSFENYNELSSTTNRQIKSNTQIGIQQRTRSRTKRVSVPSDAYDFGTSTLSNKRTFAQNNNERIFGNENQMFDQSRSLSTKKLSKEEEYLLEDLINLENTPAIVDEDIPDFE